MSYPYEQIFAGDPSAPERVAVNGIVTIFTPGDATMAPLTITTLDGLPLANPVQVNESGFGPAFQHETLDQVAWSGGGFSGLMVSYKGLKDEAVSARLAAQEAAASAQAPTAESIDQGIARADIPKTVAAAVAAAPAVTAAAAAAVDASPKIAQIEARELPDRGRLLSTTDIPSVDSVTTKGTYAVWLATNAVALGLPTPNGGRLNVYVYGNVVTQEYVAQESAARVYSRRKVGGDPWTAWDVGFSAYLGAITATPNSVDSLVREGWADVTSGATALAAGLPQADIGTVDVRPYGSNPNVQQRFNIPTLGVVWIRERNAGVWGGWKLASRGVKNVPIALTTSGPTSTNTAQQVHGRVPVKIAARASRWRVHFRNYNYRMWAGYNGSLSFIGAAFGKADKAVGELTGSFASTPVEFMGPVTTSAASQAWSSPWQTMPLEAHTDYLISYAYTSPAGQENFSSVGGGWQSANTAGFKAQTDGTLKKTGTLPLDIWIEVEVPAETPVVAYVGDSLTAGVSASLPVYDSYPNRHALAHNALPINYGFSGDSMLGYTNAAQPKLTKWSGASLARPDAMVWSLGSNDIFQGANVPAMRARFATAFPLAAAVTSSNVYLTTILPRYGAHAEYEPVRTAWNEVLRTELPGNAVMCFEAAQSVEDSSGALLDPRWGATATDFHLNRAGYARFAAQTPSVV